MTRRGFLQAMLPGAAAIVVAPTLLEELLGNRKYFLAPAGGWASEWSVNSLGGYLYSKHLGQILRNNVQPLVRFKQFAEVEDGRILHRYGDVSRDLFTWDVYPSFTGAD